ncbi:Gfo/Idh/MocA family protein [Endozoicomonas ascidiicola]|uniref:Gfo/Idh/MocA family protein n=1 Tax=Endozoicomonas ascidiicola TaxID=1698521 RepID=UPI000B17C43E|nr:Gfo/Idh/MocA family oxidoreductase [Endozoicomonas ascidiicola]
MLNIVRLLIIGLGSIGNRHLTNIKASYPEVETIILSRRDELSSYEGCRVVHDLEIAMELDVQAAFICTPSVYHLGTANKLIERGIHVFIEKPVSNTSHGLSELKQKAEEMNVKVMIGYNLRFVDSLIFYRSLLQSEKYGKALCVKAEVGQYLPDWRAGVDYRDSASAKKSLGGGALLELSHELDFLSWIFGKPVYSSGTATKVSNLEIDVDDLVIAHAGFERNGTLTNATIHLDFLQRKSFRQCKTICEQGSILWDAIADNVTLFSHDEEITLYQGDMDRNRSYLAEIKAFIQAVKHNEEVPVSIEDGLRTMTVIDSIRSSSHSRQLFNEN